MSILFKKSIRSLLDYYGFGCRDSFSSSITTTVCSRVWWLHRCNEREEKKIVGPCHAKRSLKALVLVIPKEGWVPTLFLVWHFLFLVWQWLRSFPHDATHIPKSHGFTTVKLTVMCSSISHPANSLVGNYECNSSYLRSDGGIAVIKNSWFKRTCGNLYNWFMTDLSYAFVYKNRYEGNSTYLRSSPPVQLKLIDDRLCRNWALHLFLKGASGGPRHCIWTPDCPLKLSCYPALNQTKSIHTVKHR